MLFYAENIESESEWEDNDGEVWTEEVESFPPTIDEPEEESLTQVHMESVNSHATALSIWLIRFFFSLQVIYRISDNALTFCLTFLKCSFLSWVSFVRFQLISHG